jgi:hypothetical protein
MNCMFAGIESKHFQLCPYFLFPLPTAGEGRGEGALTLSPL